MALRISIYLPKKSIDELEFLEEFATSIGDLVAKDYGNNMPTEEFDLGNLNSYIIISDEKDIEIENLQEQDLFLVIPIESEE